MQRVPAIRRQTSSPSALAPGGTERLADARLAIGAGLGGALASHAGALIFVAESDVTAGASALLELSQWSELQSPVVLVETVAKHPARRDNRALYCGAAKIPVLEAATPAEASWMVKLAEMISSQLQVPVVVRDASGVPLQHEFGSETATSTWSRLPTPLTSIGPSADFHRRKRSRLVSALGDLAELLSIEVDSDGPGGVIVAGHLGGAVQARAWARRIASLRLGMAWPLPEDTLGKFLSSRSDVLVLEEGDPFLVEELRAFCQREGLRCRIRGADIGGPRPFDVELADQVLTKFCGKARAQADAIERDGTQRASVESAVAHLGEDSGEPWPLYLARTRRGLERFALGDVRMSLFRALRELGRPTVIVADEGPSSALALRDRLVDVRVPTGLASCVAGALSQVGHVAEQAGAPLCVALLCSSGSLLADMPAIAANAHHKRDLLHIVLVEKGAAAGSDDQCELQLRAAGVQVATATLDEGSPAAAVAYAAGRSGPRALVCYYEPKAS